MSQELENKITQLRKGILELAIMGFLYQKPHYGYSLVKVLAAAGDFSMKEGTVYPILQRMTREGMLSAEWVESAQGPPRKYYRLTPLGKTNYETLVREFYRLVKLVTEPSISLQAETAADSIGKILNIRKEES
jgi:PadR family transcriptional regulator, regulatory protein PadR